MDAVEEHVGRAALVLARSPGGGAIHFTDIGVVDELAQILGKADGRTREPANVVLLRQFSDGNRIGQGTRERFVDEHRLARFEDFPRLLQVNPAINALQQHHIHLLQQLGNRVDDFNTHAALLLGKLGNAVLAGREIRAAGIASDDLDARELGVLGLVENGSEPRHMRGIKAHDAGSQRLGGFLCESRTGETKECDDGKNAMFHKWKNQRNESRTEHISGIHPLGDDSDTIALLRETGGTHSDQITGALGNDGLGLTIRALQVM